MGSQYGHLSAVMVARWRPESCAACFLCKYSSETPIGTKEQTFRPRLKGEQNGVAIWCPGSCPGHHMVT
ncbi:hypothetical protein DY000_02016345 [Brassica cretica]|uniref:Uncharacterized protein n=1 Tax=Brassica cretica TaxID=69181 RepID=A0ABQ7CPE2_BRACR|nr:hypothetical protein DY000_02016345 [Brassica cretica]